MKNRIRYFVAVVIAFGIGTTSVYAGKDNTTYGHKANPKNGGCCSVAIGLEALNRQTTSGGQNVAVGRLALNRNTKGSLNTAIGDAALYAATTGESNVAVGGNTLSLLTTGSYNTAVGSNALNAQSLTGVGAKMKYNTAIGWGAGNWTKGSKNVFIGYRAGHRAIGSNKLYISNSDTKKPLIYGDFSRKTLKVNGKMYATRFITSSDVRLKRDIQPLSGTLASVMKLQGKTYRLREDTTDSATLDIGLIAQEVEKIFPQLVTEDEQNQKGIDYSKLTVVLIEAMKEQQDQITSLEKENSELKALVSGQMEELLARVALLEGNAIAGN